MMISTVWVMRGELFLTFLVSTNWDYWGRLIVVIVFYLKQVSRQLSKTHISKNLENLEIKILSMKLAQLIILSCLVLMVKWNHETKSSGLKSYDHHSRPVRTSLNNLIFTCDDRHTADAEKEREMSSKVKLRLEWKTLDFNNLLDIP